MGTTIKPTGSGQLACSDSEADILRIAVGLGANILVQLRHVLGGLDQHNICPVTDANGTATPLPAPTNEGHPMIANLQAHWGFTTMPFGRTIAVDNLFRGNAHNEAVARLRYLISARGLGILTGEAAQAKP
jgi:hypothetical protein